MTTVGANPTAGGGGGAVTLALPLGRESLSPRFLETSGTFLGGDGFLARNNGALDAGAGAGTRRRLGELEAEETLLRLGLREKLRDRDRDGVRDELDRLRDLEELPEKLPLRDFFCLLVTGLVPFLRDLRGGLAGVLTGGGEGLYGFRRSSTGDLPTAGPPVGPVLPPPACLAGAWLGGAYGGGPRDAG